MQGLRLCIFNNFPGDNNIAGDNNITGWKTTLLGTRPQGTPGDIEQQGGLCEDFEVITLLVVIKAVCLHWKDS